MKLGFKGKIRIDGKEAEIDEKSGATEFAGKIRKVNVYIKGNRDFKVSSVKEIEPKLDDCQNRLILIYLLSKTKYE